MAKDTAVRKGIRKNVQRHRERMREAGFRLVQFWVPDARGPGFASDCRRQSLLAAKNVRVENEVLNWIESNDEIAGWK